MRLAIVSAPAARDNLSFAELKSALQLTDGNLSVHARKLEDAGYVSCRKGFDGRVPRTEYRLTPSGRRAFERYPAHRGAAARPRPLTPSSSSPRSFPCPNFALQRTCQCPPSARRAPRACWPCS